MNAVADLADAARHPIEKSRNRDCAKFRTTREGNALENVTGTRYMYFDPCHSSMKKYDPLTVVNTLMVDIAKHRIERVLV